MSVPSPRDISRLKTLTSFVKQTARHGAAMEFPPLHVAIGASRRNSSGFTAPIAGSNPGIAWPNILKCEKSGMKDVQEIRQPFHCICEDSQVDVF